LCYLRSLCRVVGVPSDEEITFADHAGRFYARRYGMAPMVGRLLGYLAVCDPGAGITELADALLASRSAIAGGATWRTSGSSAVSAAGERMDQVRIDMSSPQATGFDISGTGAGRAGPRRFAPLETPARTAGDLLEWAAFAISWWSGFRAGAGVEGRREAPDRRPAPEPPGSHRGQNTMSHARNSSATS
jgi:hypothetical protein